MVTNVPNEVCNVRDVFFVTNWVLTQHEVVVIYIIYSSISTCLI